LIMKSNPDIWVRFVYCFSEGEGEYEVLMVLCELSVRWV